MPTQHLRRRLRACVAASLAALSPCWAAAQGLTLRTLAVCDDVNEWPPFTFLAPVPQAASAAGEGGSQNIMGFSVEVLRRILAPRGIALRIQLLPWVRCLREVEAGTTFQMTLNASTTPERQRRFWMSEPYHATTPGYVYSRRRFPNGPPVRSAQDLLTFRLCGVHGYNYSVYGLRDDQIDRGAFSFSQVVSKLQMDRCDLGVGELEAIRGTRLTAKPLVDNPEIGFGQIAGLAQVDFHMLVSRQHPQGEALVQFINKGLRDMRVRGELQALHKRYTN